MLKGTIVIPIFFVLLSCSSATTNKEKIIKCASFYNTVVSMSRERPTSSFVTNPANPQPMDSATQQSLNDNKINADYVIARAIPEAAESYKKDLDPIVVQKLNRDGENSARDFFDRGDSGSAASYVGDCVNVYVAMLK